MDSTEIQADFYLAVTGNCFYASTEKGWKLLAPQCMRAIVNKDGTIKAYIYRSGKDEVHYPPEQIKHLTRSSMWRFGDVA